MRTQSATFVTAAVLLSAIFVPAVRAAAPAKDSVKAEIPDEAARQVIVTDAAKLSHPIDPTPLSTNLKSPFEFDASSVAPSSGGPAASGAARGGSGANKSARDLIESIASSVVTLRPVVGIDQNGKSFILLSGKRYGKGDKIPLKLDNNVYDVEIADIPNTTSYTLRYGGETTTRTTRPTGK